MTSSTQETWTRHTNPDGSIGGLVSSHASVGDNVHLNVTSVVLGGSDVPSNTALGAGAIFSPAGVVDFDFSKPAAES